MRWDVGRIMKAVEQWAAGRELLVMISDLLQTPAQHSSDPHIRKSYKRALLRVHPDKVRVCESVLLGSLQRCA